MGGSKRKTPRSGTTHVAAPDADGGPPGRPPLLVKALDSLGRLAQARLPWHVRATNVFLPDGDDLLRIDLVAEFGTRSFFLAVTCSAGVEEWEFVRHRMTDRTPYQDVCVECYEVGESGISQRASRMDCTDRLFKLSTIAARLPTPKARSIGSEAVDVGVTSLRAQDALGRQWLPAPLEQP